MKFLLIGGKGHEFVTCGFVTHVKECIARSYAMLLRISIDYCSVGSTGVIQIIMW